MKQNALPDESPELIKEWDFERNEQEGITPSDVTCGSHKKVWWQCKKGHSWKTQVYHRTGGKGCPYCCGKRVLIGYNDLASKAPGLLSEWDNEKNDGLFPTMVTPGSNRKIWWKCGECHTWQASVYDRYSGKGCPYCCGQKVWAGYNDLASLEPYLATEWDRDKNPGITPSMVTLRSNRKVWWKCKDGHCWKAPVSDRTSGKGCPFCSGRKAIPGYSDLGTLNKTLSGQWDYVKNKGLFPKDFTQGSKKKVWWKCKEGHSWQAAIYSRNGGGRNCPYCSGKRVLSGYNDLATTNSSLANEWDYEKNDGKYPEYFTECSKKKVWWKCDKGHSWGSTIHNRTLGNGCPYCSGRNAIIGYNDLRSLNPDFLNEWDYEKNHQIKPEQMMANTHIRVWWKCKEGHSWKAAIYSRTNASGCPYCAGKVTVKTRFIT